VTQEPAIVGFLHDANDGLKERLVVLVEHPRSK
jgi:hypothetical protein